jgi:hypothetical protein
MIELLVGMVIAALIITPMLGFVVNVLNSDVREQAKTNSEQELQAAIDYIAQDMSQAIYVYDDVTDIEAQLPHSGDANKEPILAFWKREYVENALDPSGGICENPDTDSCNDTFVLSLVAYYEITETDNSSIWCQPSGGTCPKRIARFQIQDGVTDLSGNYVCQDDPSDDGRNETVCSTDAKKKFMRDLGFNDYQNNPTEWTKKSDETYSNDVITLVNYIEGFNLDNPLVDTDDDGTADTPLIEASGYKFAKIEVVGNALRRSQNDFSCEDTPATATTPATYKNDPYCPKATAQVGARSGFGE